MRVIRQEFGPFVNCDATNDIAYTRVAEGTAFCANCGATTHKEADK